jgi:hypothetical protein
MGSPPRHTWCSPYNFRDNDAADLRCFLELPGINSVRRNPGFSARTKFPAKAAATRAGFVSHLRRSRLSLRFFPGLPAWAAHYAAPTALLRSGRQLADRHQSAVYRRSESQHRSGAQHRWRTEVRRYKDKNYPAVARSSRRYTILPPTIVATGAPRKVRPSKGVLRDLLGESDAW